jgi:hypothetical protein
MQVSAGPDGFVATPDAVDYSKQVLLTEYLQQRQADGNAVLTRVLSRVRKQLSPGDQVYRARFLRHLKGGYAAFAAGGRCSARMAAGGWKPCRSMSQVVL